MTERELDALGDTMSKLALVVRQREKLRASLLKMVLGWKYGNLSEEDFIEAWDLAHGQ